MQRILFIWLLLFIPFHSLNAQSASGLCVAIANYFQNPPDKFVNERGVELGKGRWRSKLTFPNASCVIRYSETKLSYLHTASCTFVTSRNRSVVESAYLKSITDLRACLSNFKHGPKFAETRKDRNSDDEESVTWEYADGDDEYSFDTSIGNLSGEFAHHLGVYFRSKK